MREKVDDHDFTDYYYDQDKNNLQFLKTWGGTWSEYGGAQAQTDWDNLVNFITPMIDPETRGLAIDWDDEIIAGTVIAHDGQIVHPTLVHGEGE